MNFGTAAAGVVDVRNRFVDFPRVTRTDTDFYRVVAGLKGNILKSIDLDYDINFNTSQDEIESRATNLLQVQALNAALASGAVNLFSTGNQDAALSQAGVFGTNFRDQKTALNVFDAGLTAFPVKFAGRPARIRHRLRVSFREDSLQRQPGNLRRQRAGG